MRDAILKGFLLTVSNASTGNLKKPEIVENSRNKTDAYQNRNIEIKNLSKSLDLSIKSKKIRNNRPPFGTL